MASSKPTSRTRRPSSRKPQGSGKVLPAASGKAIMAAISKPWPVVIATLATCLLYGAIPSAGFLGGVTLSVAGIGLYYSARK